MAELKRSQLVQLGAEKLANLLFELAQRDHTIEKRLVMVTASDSQCLKMVRAQISGLKRIKRFHDWKSAHKLHEKIELVIQSIGELQVDPKEGFELVAALHETDNAVYGNCDDSSGMIADLYKHEASRLLIRFGKQCENKSWVAQRIFELNQQNDYGVRDQVLSAACEILPEPELRKLIDRYSELAAAEDVNSEKTGEESRPRPSWPYWNAVQDLARGIKDASLYELALKSSWGENALNAIAWNDIAKVHLDAGDPETALQRLGNIDDSGNYHSYETERLRIDIQKSLGNTHEVTAALRKRFLASPSAKTLADLMEYLAPEDRQLVIDELVQIYTAASKLNLSFLEFTLDELATKVTENYVLERAHQLDGDQYYLLAPIAKRLAEKDAPLAATLILRALADSILQRGASKNYKIAVGYIKRAAKLTDSIEQWKEHPNHETYFESLRAQHARKSAFWSKMNA